MFACTRQSAYFGKLMKSRFSHIFHSFVIALLFAGFAAHIAIPFLGDLQKNAFTQWLDQNVKVESDNLNDDLRNRIKELPDEAANLWTLIQDASKLISENEDNFRIAPFTEERHDDQVTTWLIGQWSSYKHQQNNTKAVLPKIIAPVYKWLTQVTSIKASFTTPAVLNTPTFRATVMSVPQVIISLLSPPASGISINAP